jgi:hypothetical protein
MSRIPADGLAEVCEDLRRAYEFYSQRSKVEDLPAVQRTVSARLRHTYERPAFQVAEE